MRSDTVEISTKEILNSCDAVWEEVTNIHGDILDEDSPNNELEARASRLEDLIFEIKDRCENIIWQAKSKTLLNSINIPVDQEQEISTSSSSGSVSDDNSPLIC